MGAYFQNQVVTKNSDNQEQVLCYQSEGLKFMESQYALKNSMLTTVANLKENSSIDNTAKVYCVCDYDEGDYDAETLKYFNGKARQWISSSSNPSVTYFDEGCYDRHQKNEVKLPVARDGIIVNKTKREYIDIAKIVDVAENTYEREGNLLISPLAMLTRCSMVRMGGGDIRFEEAEELKIKAILARWYDNEIYWCENTTDNLIGLIDITDKTLWAEVRWGALPINPETYQPEGCEISE